MKIMIFILKISLILVFLENCQSRQTSSSTALPTKDIGQDSLKIKPGTEDYGSQKKKVETLRVALKNAFARQEIPLDSVRNAFTEALTDEIFPYWYGTNWSFDGHADSPRSGEIACGYFVSTTLLDVGLRINRYKLAQQWPEDEARMLSLGGVVRHFFREPDDSSGIIFEKNLKNGLYFAGLGTGHVGFLLKKGSKMWFIHSNYTSPQVVIAQPIPAAVFIHFDEYYIADLTNNDRLLNYWLNGTNIPLSTEGKSLIEIR